MALWRVRATVVDKPGFLAVLAASLALRSVNILSVGVHITEQGAVDDFLVDAPEATTAEQLLAAVERGRGRDAWVARAEAHSLVDAPTRALDLATYLVRDPSAVSTVLAELVGAEARWRPDAGPEQAGIAGDQMWVPAPRGGAWLLERAAPGFTPAEYARAQALLSVAAALAAPSAGRTRRTAAPAPPETVLLLADGRELSLRRADLTDLPAVRAMHERCSEASLRRRYLGAGAPPPGPAATRLLAPPGGFALLAVVPGAFAERVVAVASLAGEGVQAQLGLLVEDAWQGRGVGTALLRRTLAAATGAGFDALLLHTEARHDVVPGMLRRCGVPVRAEPDEGVVTYTVRLPVPQVGPERERSGPAGASPAPAVPAG